MTSQQREIAVQVYLDESVQLGELGRRLLADASGEVLAEYRDGFLAASRTARQRLSQPLTPQQFAMTQAIADSASLSADVIAAVWQSMHAGR